MQVEPVVWENFEWRAGAETYRFEISDKGLIGRLKVSDGRHFALPLVVWEAMLECVKTNRKSKTRPEANLPARYGAVWTDAEINELISKFQAGLTIYDLAKDHARTVWAIEGQLAKLGLWDRIERRPLA